MLSKSVLCCRMLHEANAEAVLQSALAKARGLALSAESGALPAGEESPAQVSRIEGGLKK